MIDKVIMERFEELEKRISELEYKIELIEMTMTPSTQMSDDAPEKFFEKYKMTF